MFSFATQSELLVQPPCSLWLLLLLLLLLLWVESILIWGGGWWMTAGMNLDGEETPLQYILLVYRLLDVSHVLKQFFPLVQYTPLIYANYNLMTIWYLNFKEVFPDSTNLISIMNLHFWPEYPIRNECLQLLYHI